MCLDAVRRNPLAKKTTDNTIRVAASKWFKGSRDRNGGKKQRMLQALQNEAEEH